MAKYTGKSMEFKFGTFTIPSGHLTKVEIPRTRDEHEATGAGQLDKEFFPMERSATITVEGWEDAAGTIRTALEYSTSEATFTFFPQGNTSGKPTVTGSAFITQYTSGVTHNQVVPFSVTFRVNGAITFGTVA